MATKLAPAAPALPVRTTEITFDDVGYPGWKATVRTNFGIGLFDAVAQSGQLQEFPALIAEVLVSWNFVDAKGAELPADEDGLRRAPHDLLEHIWAKTSTAAREARLGKMTAAD